ncbi:MAG: HAMP domain-containing histidine kinase [Oscillospiraceae bacterium]|nr:HAMP domain-containing histidine kinase [Oscillospiraceae bacterium]
MKSLYRRQLAMTAGLILLSFLLLGIAFVMLSYRYTITERREAMERNANYISRYTSAMLSSGRDVRDEFFQVYVSSIAQITDSYVLLSETDGEIVYGSDSGVTYPYLGQGQYLPEDTVQAVLQNGSYTGMNNLGGLYGENRYVVGLPIKITMGEQTAVSGLVFVATDASSIMEMWWALANIFFFTAVVVLILAFITSSITSLRMTQPLKDMADAVRKFGHGDFGARVDAGNRSDEIGELADAFNTMADSLAKSEAKRSEFVANISHELKTPMTTIAGFADGILDGTIPPEQERDYLQVISAETRRLSRLVRKMLDLSRLQSTENVTAQEQFDVVEIMARVLVSLEPKITARNLDVDAQLPEEPLMVWGDPDAITQVCYNLLDNAIKFSPEGGTLGAAISAKGSKAQVTVRNQGETIPAEELPLLFDRFHKSDRSRSVDRDGVGLGLYIVKTILGTHKENITVASEDGVTEFVFTLTLA